MKTNPEIIQAAERIYREINADVIQRQSIIEDILLSPNEDEKWIIIIEAFAENSELSELYWKTYFTEYTTQRSEAIVWLEDKVLALKSRAQFQLRKYRQFEDLDTADARKMMKRFVSTHTQALKYEEKLQAIKGGSE